MNRDILFIPHSTRIPELKAYWDRAKPQYLIVGAEKKIHGIITPEALLRILLKFRKDSTQEHIILYSRYLVKPSYVQKEEDLNWVIKKILSEPQAILCVLGDKEDVIGIVRSQEIIHYLWPQAVLPGSDEPYLLNESDFYYYESFFQKAPYMMHSVNSEGIIQLANETLHEVLEYPYPKLIGQHISKIYTPENVLQAQQALAQIFEGRFQPVVRSEMVTSRGKVIPVEITSKILTNVLGVPVGTLTISRPLELKLLIKKLDVTSEAASSDLEKGE